MPGKLVLPVKNAYNVSIGAKQELQGSFWATYTCFRMKMACSFQLIAEE
jgi:hypothetical protein